MFLARIDGTLTASRKDHRLAGVRFLIAQRLEADGSAVGEPLVVLDRMGAGRGSTVLVSTDGNIAREWLGKASRRASSWSGSSTGWHHSRPSRVGVMRLGIVAGTSCCRGRSCVRGTTLLLVEPVTAANLAARNGQGGGKTLVVADQSVAWHGRDDCLRRGQRGGESVSRAHARGRLLRAGRPRLPFQPPETADRSAAEGRG